MTDALALAHQIAGLVAVVIALLILLLTLRVLVAIRAYLGEFVLSLPPIPTPAAAASEEQMRSAMNTPNAGGMPTDWSRWFPASWQAPTAEERAIAGDGVVSDVFGAGDADVFDPLEASQFGSRQTRGRDEQP